MADNLTPANRKRVMAKIRNKDTKPEILVRKMLHGLGYRFRLHRSDLPGTPDLYLAKYKSAIFVHGCFWHGHEGCPRGKRPKTRTNFWSDKIDKNIERDKKVELALKTLGHSCFIVWECELKDPEKLAVRLREQLDNAYEKIG